MCFLHLKNKVLLILLLNTSMYYSQTYFNKLFGLPKPFADIAVPAPIEIKGEGYIHSYLPWNYQTGEMQIVFQKLNYSGDTLWRKVYGKSGMQYASTYIISTIDSNYAMGGYTFEVNDTTMYFYLLKVNPNGDSIWSKKYPPLAKARVVNSTMVKQTIDKGYILCGARQPYTTTGNPLAADIFVVKTDSMGNMQWSKQYGGSGHDVATSVIQTPNKGFLIGGYSSGSSSSDNDTYLLKTDSVGTFIWDTVYGEWGYNDGSNKMIELKD
ncbi:MAG: hypothetical protein IT235_05115 [Bacteroidia bacterium]|nr:hypothetical protein [Bacteroidia bacterium]